MQEKKKIGIYSGSFDPITKAHIFLAKNLINLGYIDKVILVPASDLYEYKNLLDFKKRVDMIKLTISNDESIIVDKIEYSKSYKTYNLLEYFKGDYNEDEIYFICGSDNYINLNTWHDSEKLIKENKFMVLLRNHFIEDLENIYPEYKDNFIFIDNDILISSSLAREYIKNNNELVKEVLDEKVVEYVRKNKLYK